MTKRLALGSLILTAASVLGTGVAQAAQPWTGGCEIKYTIDESAVPYERQIVRAVRDIGGVTDIAFVRVNESPDIRYSAGGDSGALAPAGYVVAGSWNYQTRVVWLTSINLPGPVKRGIVMHETMHALGVDHSDDPESIMYPAYQGTTAFTLEDLSDLLTVSVANNCGY